jgi:alpha-glucosidase
MVGTTEIAGASGWWRDAVVYQVYIRSFSDGNGDGVGDIAGIRSRLDYLRDLGVDALWINPWYPSPMADGGYDVADYRAVEPVFGTADEAAAMIEEAHGHGLRVILDIVPNHTSDRHAWFQAALASSPGSPERARYWFRPGRGIEGAEPPNDLRSVFGGPAWTRVDGADGGGEWYLHLFDSSQPDLNWDDQGVRAEFESVLRFWFDRGVDGFRIDVANGLVKQPDLPDLGPHDEEAVLLPADRPDHPHWDRDGVHEIYRGWRRVADSYPEPPVFAAEAWVRSPERLARYLRPDELHTAFNFDYLRAPWDADALRKVIDESLATVAAVGAPATWVLSNHDVVRHVSRLGRPLTPGAYSLAHLPPVDTLDRDLGTRRARAAALLLLALPGSAYVYQGDELGLWEVEDLPDEVRQDPTWERSGHTEVGRDGCRVPLPWSGSEAPFGFGPHGTAPWLPQPADFATVTAQVQDGDPDSMLTLYRTALRLRREQPALGDGELTWLPAEPAVLAFSRGDGFTCVVNLSNAPVPLPEGTQVLLASGPLDGDGLLPADTAAWLTA